jgi:RimJ/RimL family protein N-acetyltransferase
MTLADLDDFAEMLGDAAAMRFYPAPFTREQAREWIEWNVSNYEAHDYGQWALSRRESGEHVGDCGLTWQRVGYADARELGIAWQVRRELWNQGLATEAALAVCEFARSELLHPRLIATIQPDNLPSQAVARRIGMECEREDVLEGERRLIFSMSLASSSGG